MEDYSRGAHTVCILHFRVGAGPSACRSGRVERRACRHGTRSGRRRGCPVKRVPKHHASGATRAKRERANSRHKDRDFKVEGETDD